MVLTYVWRWEVDLFTRTVDQDISLVGQGVHFVVDLLLGFILECYSRLLEVRLLVATYLVTVSVRQMSMGMS